MNYKSPRNFVSFKNMCHTIYWSLVMHICVSELGSEVITWTALIWYQMDQQEYGVNSKLIFIQEHKFYTVVLKMLVILSRPLWVWTMCCSAINSLRFHRAVDDTPFHARLQTPRHIGDSFRGAVKSRVSYQLSLKSIRTIADHVMVIIGHAWCLYDMEALCILCCQPEKC